jgi:hypothetical protein
MRLATGGKVEAMRKELGILVLLIVLCLVVRSSIRASSTHQSPEHGPADRSIWVFSLASASSLSPAG